MIYGKNFNNTEIPPGVKRIFRATVRIPEGNVVCGECCWSVDYSRCNNESCRCHTAKVTYRLQGVGQSATERDFMLAQARNGRRKLHVEVRKTPAGPWYGIYTV